MTQLDSRVGSIDLMGEKTVRVGDRAAEGEDRVEIVSPAWPDNWPSWVWRMVSSKITLLQNGGGEDPRAAIPKLPNNFREVRTVRLSGFSRREHRLPLHFSAAQAHQ